MSDHRINIKIGAKDQTRGALGNVTNGFKKLAGVIAGYLSARAIFGFGKSTVEAFMRQEDAVTALSAALSKNGEDVSNLIPKYQKFAAAIQTVTKHGDEGTLEIMAYGRNLGIATEKLEEATRAAVGLAAKFKLDLRSAMMLVGRASQGQTQMLTRYGIILDDTLDEQGKFNALLKIGASNFRLAADEAGTMRGRLEQAKNAFGDMKESIGESIAEGFNLTDMFDGLALSIQAANQAGDFSQMAADLRILQDALKPVADLFGGISDTIKGIAGVAGSSFEIVRKEIDSLKKGDFADAMTIDKGEREIISGAWMRGFEERAGRRVKRMQTVNQLRGERAATLRRMTEVQAPEPLPPTEPSDATLRDVVNSINELKQK